MESVTPLRLKFKIGNRGTSTTPEPTSPSHPTIINKMTEEEVDQMGSEDEGDYEDDWQEEIQGDDPGGEEDDSQQSRPQLIHHEDGLRERHKKSKKKKKKKEKEKERHKHKHHKERIEFEEDEPPCKKLMTHQISQEKPSKAAMAAFKELLEVLLQLLQKKDPQQFFVFPVTDLIAPGYSSIINTPMDFSKMTQKVQEGAYSCLSQFQEDLRLICNNCMTYNQPDTIYYKAAKRLLQAGEKILSPERILPLKREMTNLLLLSKELLGFDINAEIPCLDLEEGSQDSTKLSDDENGIEQMSNLTAFIIIFPLQISVNLNHFKMICLLKIFLNKLKRQRRKQQKNLLLKSPLAHLVFCDKGVDGTTTLNFLTGCEGNDPNQKEKPVSLGLLTGKLTQGSSSLHNYRDDKRSIAKPVKPLYYGTFSSFCPSYDSTFANLNKEESEMVYATYGNEAAIQYAESICDFSRDCDIAMHLVDELLDVLTQSQHSRTKAFIEDRRRIQQEEQKIHSLLYTTPNEDQSGFKQVPKDISPNFTMLKTLKDIGIDTSFLNTFEKLEQREKVVGSKLAENATLIANLAKEQKERLSKPLPQNITNLPGPSQNEVKLAAKVTEGLIAVARQIPPGALAPVPTVRRALGIKMMPIISESSEQIEVDIEETSSQESTPPQGFNTEVSPRQRLVHGSSNMDPHMENILIQTSSAPNSSLTDKKLKEILNSS
ncbi:Bromodomain-containing protein 7 [Armadillidium nasatum]|uniref:Bromodomain-containing protein 7 n=1 Tax=Armadillidium nasatum TaxID=96803 RepID=A0A5N5SIA7_9CRUS|nr:Bromodomain-containing protein 7 [Armadillidium nasatum]